MIKELIIQWEENKQELETYFRTTPQSEYCTYQSIVKKVFELCLPDGFDYRGWNLEMMTVIDNGDYQGTEIFIIPADAYQPNIDDYVVTHTYYGSCSGCDTLQSINNHNYSELPTDSQIKDYMTLALHLVQKTKKLGGDG